MRQNDQVLSIPASEHSSSRASSHSMPVGIKNIMGFHSMWKRIIGAGDGECCDLTPGPTKAESTSTNDTTQHSTYF